MGTVLPKNLFKTFLDWDEIEESLVMMERQYFEDSFDFGMFEQLLAERMGMVG